MTRTESIKNHLTSTLWFVPMYDLMETQADLLFELAKNTVAADADLETVSRYYKKVQKSL